ncbi:hypothetical protein ACJJTC_016380 [Scirpophaga incertulas]
MFSENEFVAGSYPTQFSLRQKVLVAREVAHVLLGRVGGSAGVALVALQRHGAHGGVRHLRGRHRELLRHRTWSYSQVLVAREVAHVLLGRVGGSAGVALVALQRHGAHGGVRHLRGRHRELLRHRTWSYSQVLVAREVAHVLLGRVGGSAGVALVALQRHGAHGGVRHLRGRHRELLRHRTWSYSQVLVAREVAHVLLGRVGAGVALVALQRHGAHGGVRHLRGRHRELLRHRTWSYSQVLVAREVAHVLLGRVGGSAGVALVALQRHGAHGGVRHLRGRHRELLRHRTWSYSQVLVAREVAHVLLGRVGAGVALVALQRHGAHGGVRHLRGRHRELLRHRTWSYSQVLVAREVAHVLLGRVGGSAGVALVALQRHGAHGGVRHLRGRHRELLRHRTWSYSQVLVAREVAHVLLGRVGAGVALVALQRHGAHGGVRHLRGRHRELLRHRTWSYSQVLVAREVAHVLLGRVGGSAGVALVALQRHGAHGGVRHLRGRHRELLRHRTWSYSQVLVAREVAHVLLGRVGAGVALVALQRHGAHGGVRHLRGRHRELLRHRTWSYSQVLVAREVAHVLLGRVGGSAGVALVALQRHGAHGGVRHLRGRHRELLRHRTWSYSQVLVAREVAHVLLGRVGGSAGVALVALQRHGAHGGVRHLRGRHRELLRHRTWSYSQVLVAREVAHVLLGRVGAGVALVALQRHGAHGGVRHLRGRHRELLRHRTWSYSQVLVAREVAHVLLGRVGAGVALVALQRHGAHGGTRGARGSARTSRAGRRLCRRRARGPAATRSARWCATPAWPAS